MQNESKPARRNPVARYARGSKYARVQGPFASDNPQFTSWGLNWLYGFVVIAALVVIVVLVCLNMDALGIIKTTTTDTNGKVMNLTEIAEDTNMKVMNLTFEDPCIFDPNPVCDDSNECTEDGVSCTGECVNRRLDNGSPCNDLCFSSTSCSAGKCEGDCIGNCEVVGDCPDLNDLSDPGIIYSRSCGLSGICLYQTISDKPAFLPTPCDNSQYGAFACAKHFNVDNLPQTMACMNHEPTCVGGELQCVHYFTCACPTLGPPPA